MICTEIEKKNYEDMAAQNKEIKTNDNQQSYKFQGNKNAKLKKSISYFSQPNK